MKNILILDDQLNDYIQSIIKALNYFDYETLYFETPNKAWEEYLRRSGEISCIIVDLMIPEGDEKRNIPDDSCEVGYGFFRKLIETKYPGYMIVLTNARSQHHKPIFDSIRNEIRNNEKIYLHQKDDISPLSLSKMIMELV